MSFLTAIKPTALAVYDGYFFLCNHFIYTCSNHSSLHLQLLLLRLQFLLQLKLVLATATKLLVATMSASFLFNVIRLTLTFVWLSLLSTVMSAMTRLLVTLLIVITTNRTWLALPASSFTSDLTTARFTPGVFFYVLITFNMLPIFAIAHLAGKAIKKTTSSDDFKNGTSALHKAAAIGASVLLPGTATAEMRRDAFRK